MSDSELPTDSQTARGDPTERDYAPDHPASEGDVSSPDREDGTDTPADSEGVVPEDAGSLEDDHPGMGESGRQRRAEEERNANEVAHRILTDADEQARETVLAYELPVTKGGYNTLYEAEIRTPSQEEVASFHAALPRSDYEPSDEFQQLAKRCDQEFGKTPLKAARDNDLSDDEKRMVLRQIDEQLSVFMNEGYEASVELAAKVTTFIDYPLVPVDGENGDDSSGADVSTDDGDFNIDRSGGGQRLDSEVTASLIRSPAVNRRVVGMLAAAASNRADEVSSVRQFRFVESDQGN